jgi:hypothetical protein
LEILHIDKINLGEIFSGHSENNGGSSQQSSSLAQIESKCSFMPSTLKFLRIFDNADVRRDPDNLANIFLSLLANCPQLRFMQIYINTRFDLFKLIRERNPSEFDKLIRFVKLF